MKLESNAIKRDLKTSWEKIAKAVLNYYTACGLSNHMSFKVICIKVSLLSIRLLKCKTSMFFI